MPNREHELLRQADQDVPPDPSSGNSGNPNDHQSGTNNPSGGGQPSRESGAQGDPSGRTPEQVKREMDRKFDEWGDRFGRLENMVSTVLERTAGTGSAQPAVLPSGQPDLNSYSVAQLEAFKASGQVPENLKSTFDQLIQDRKIKEMATSLVRQELSEHEFKTRKKESEALAFRAYPELRDKMGSFRQVTNQALLEMGQDVTTKNPMALLHAAQIAAGRLGIKGRPTVSHDVAPGGTGPVPNGQGSSEMSDDKMHELAQRLGRSMPGGKFSDEALKRIKEASGIYRDNKHLVIRQ